MKIIAIGDPHIKTDNIPDVNLFIDRLEKLCIEEKPDIIVVLGDVLHTHERLHTIPLNKAYEFINRLRNITHTYVLVGNHDYTSNCQFLTENHWMNSMKEWDKVTIVDKTINLSIKEFNIILVPYVPVGRFIEALETGDKNWKQADIIFAHQEFRGCKMGAIVSQDGDEWLEDYPQVVSGHIHSKQKIGKNIYYCGSSMQHAFGESEDNIIPLIKLRKNNKYQLVEKDLDLPKKKIIYTDIDNIEDIKTEKTNDKVKISITGDYEEFKAFKKTKKYKEIINNGTKLVFKPKKIDIQKEENRELRKVEENDFNRVLIDLVYKEKNKYMYQIYEKIVNDKNINEEDILFL